MNEHRIVFIHGFMGSALNWGRIRNGIESQNSSIKTFAIDLLGHALNHPQSEEAYTNAHLALVSDLNRQLSAIQPTHVLAHSFGFRPALILSQSNPELIPHLIVEDSSPELSSSAHAYLKDILNAPMPFRTREDAKQYFDSKFGTQSVLSRFLLSNIKSTADNQATWRFDRKFLEALLDESLKEPLWDLWRKYSGQSSIIYGTLQGGLDKSILKKMEAAKPGVTSYPIKAGHWVHSDAPDEFIETVLMVLNRSN